MSPERVVSNFPKDPDFKLRVAQILLNLEIDFPGKLSKEAVARFASKDGQSLGVSVAQVIVEETRELIGSAYTIAKPDLFSLVTLPLILNNYSRVARAFLIAEEVVRNGYLSVDLFPEDDIEKIAQLFESVEAEGQSLETLHLEWLREGRGDQLVTDGELEQIDVAEQFRVDIFNKQLGHILRRCDTPLDFVDQVAQYYLQAPYPPEEHGEPPQLVRGLKDRVLDMGRDRFYDLYNAAMRVRGKALGMTPQELHRDFLEQQKRKHGEF